MDLLQKIDNTNKNFKRNLGKILRFAQDTSFARFAPMTNYGFFMTTVKFFDSFADSKIALNTQYQRIFLNYPPVSSWHA